MKRISVFCIISACFILLSASCGRGKKASNTQSDKTTTTVTAPVETKDEQSKEIPDKAHNSRNSLDFEGTYEGTLPCADCAGIDIKLTLTKDRYKLVTKYLGTKGNNKFSNEGRYTWSEDDNIIILEGDVKPNYYAVGENVLYCLDVNMERVRGALSQNYVLRKTK